MPFKLKVVDGRGVLFDEDGNERNADAPKPVAEKPQAAEPKPVAKKVPSK